MDDLIEPLVSEPNPAPAQTLSAVTLNLARLQKQLGTTDGPAAIPRADGPAVIPPGRQSAYDHGVARYDPQI